MNSKPKAIVVFDSGVGGLTVLSELKRREIDETFVYLADSANSPYGDKTKEEVIFYVLQSFKRLNRLYDFKAIIIACNTASAYTKDLLEHIYQVPVYSVIDAAAEYVNCLPFSATTDVLATKLTASSHAYQKAIPHKPLREIGCPLFVPFIESTKYEDQEKRQEIVYQQLLGVATENAEMIILGCTHYPLLVNEIKAFYGGNTTIINPSFLLAEKVEREYPLKHRDFDVSYYLTGDNTIFNSFATKMMNQRVYAEILRNDRAKLDTAIL